jgi:GT2 family glycosyltransferase
MWLPSAASVAARGRIPLDLPANQRQQGVSAQVGDPASNSGHGRPTASVAICTYTDRRWSVLVDAVESVERQLKQGDEIVIVIDHAPALLDRVGTRFPHLRVVENSHGRGLSGARNTAVDCASGELIAFLDDDAVPEPGWLDELRRSYSDASILGVGGFVRPRWPSAQPQWMPDEFLWVVGCSYSGLPTAVSPIRNPIGANMSFRSAVLERVGGFSESLGRVGTLPVGCEETELSMRVGSSFSAGVIIHQPAAVVDHHVTSERMSFRYFVRRCWSEGQSKAVVTRLVAQSGSLSTERSYVTKTVLPAIGREITRAIRGEHAGWRRAGALAAGTAVTGLSYALHLARGRGKS